MEYPRLIVVVTGANSGVGFAICHRLLIQLSQSNPPDAQPLFGAVSPERGSDGLYPCDALTLILACRSTVRAETARRQLRAFLGAHVAKERQRPGYDGHADRFLKNLEINIHCVDLSHISSIFAFGNELSQKYPYISHLVCNAGISSCDGIMWPTMISQALHSLVDLGTYPTYLRQPTGILSEDGLGFVWQCNVFGHYVLYRTLQPLLALFSSEHSRPARVLWMSSLEGQPGSYEPDDRQLIKTGRTYQASKYQMDLISAQLNLRATATGADSETRHILVQPGIAYSNFAVNIIGPVLQMGMVILFYLLRWWGSPNHVIKVYKAAVAPVHMCLVPSSCIPKTLRDAASVPRISPWPGALKDGFSESDSSPAKMGSGCNRLGREYVLAGGVCGWEENKEESHKLVEMCERLYQAFLKAEGHVLRDADDDICI